MFDRRELSGELAAVRDEHAPTALVFDAESDFETLPPAQAEDLGLLVDALDPATHPTAWLPSDAPAVLDRYVSETFTIGGPGDGSVTWTRQTEPPVVLVKPRVQGSPDAFVAFLIAEALVSVGIETRLFDTERPLPEHFLGFFRDTYPSLAEAVPFGPNTTYQLAAALYDGWVGLHTRPVFAEWPETHPRLGDAWADAGERISPRVDGLPAAISRGEQDFPEAAELACSAIKHDLDLPAPFTALDTTAYRDRGPEYAIAWAEKTFDALLE